MNASTYPQFIVGNNGKQTVSPLNNLLRLLLLFLIIQILVGIAIYAYHRVAQPEAEANALLDFNSEAIDKLIIHDVNNKVILTRSAGGWQLPDLHQLPVDSAKLDDLLDKLRGTKLTWPVTTTESSHARFEVVENKFQRRVEFFTGDKKAGDIFLGNSPGFKKIHLRRANEKEVYAVELSGFDFATTSKDWLNSGLLAVKQPLRIRGADYDLQQDSGLLQSTNESPQKSQEQFLEGLTSPQQNWRLTQDAAASVNNSALTRLLSALSGLSVQEPITNRPDGERVNLDVKTAEGEWRYEFVKTGADYSVKRSDRDIYFKISAAEYENIARVKKQDLIAPAAQTQPASAAENKN